MSKTRGNHPSHSFYAAPRAPESQVHRATRSKRCITVEAMGFLSGGLLQDDAAPPKGAKDMLLLLPRGAYTTCRTVGGAGEGKVLMLAFQIARLEQSLRLLFPTVDLDAAAAASDRGGGDTEAAGGGGLGKGRQEATPVVLGTLSHVLPRGVAGGQRDGSDSKAGQSIADAGSSALRAFLEREVPRCLAAVLAQDLSPRDGAAVDAMTDSMMVLLCCPSMVDSPAGAAGSKQTIEGGQGVVGGMRQVELKIASMSMALPAPAPSVIVQVAANSDAVGWTITDIECFVPRVLCIAQVYYLLLTKPLARTVASPFCLLLTQAHSMF